MLVINNGVPKSGSTWIQQVLQRLCKIPGPSKTWQREGWHNPSIAPPKMAPFLASPECRNNVVCIKAHYRADPKMTELFLKSDVRMIVSYRNMPDTIVSLYYHERKYNGCTMSLEQWLATEADVRARDFLTIRTGWDSMSPLMIPFEQMRENPVHWAMEIARYSEANVSEDEAAAFCAQTMKKTDTIQENSHVRTGGAGAAHELPEHWRKVIEDIERETIAAHERRREAVS
tara:strand:- start:4963 stop:5655 length:693 start_codon:yes stop_codon:yes gene_type:complete